MNLRKNEGVIYVMETILENLIKIGKVENLKICEKLINNLEKKRV